MQPTRLRRVAPFVVGLALLSCANDIVLPDSTIESVCGNGVLETGEQCDVASAGCVACVIVPTWTCTTTDCTETCGDGVTSADAKCTSPHRETDCDMTGYWAVRETDFTRDTILNGIQVSSNWYLYRLEQAVDDFHVVEEIDCGTYVTGSATVEATPGTKRGLLYRNRMDAASSNGARHGTSKKVDGGCAITLDRWYQVRGALDTFLPKDFSSKPPLASLPPLPAVADPVAGGDIPPGAEDTDGDGILGVAYSIAGIVSGIRNSAQRDWKEYATNAGAPVPAAAITLAIPGRYDLQESVLRVTGCGTGCPLLAAGAHAAGDIPARLTLSYLGKDYGGPRVGRVVAGVPRQSIDADLTTCAKVRLVLPHDPSKP